LHVARATCEVILAGGSINSPQLLQLSGVGDPALLAQNGIGVVHAAPGVGENLVDHYAVRIASRVQGVGSLNERTHFPRLVLEVLKYLVARRGVLASAVAHAYGFVSVASQAGRPDLQLLFAPASFEGGKMGRTKMETVPGMTCGVQQLRPLSRGHVRIQSNDPFSAPMIQPNFLKHDEDIATLVAGIRFMRRLYAAPSLARYVAHESWPGAAVESDTQIVEFARTTGSTVYHPVGTCRMGSGADAPVDPATLRVKGIVGLRVIDASVMPSMVSGNTYATTIMIAEKGADMVLSDQS
jgi:choline dehydrogenase-like flavoprotein